jgi:N-acetylglucosaminyl-diphospho-decaprenol L-rhamnosyltransferase
MPENRAAASIPGETTTHAGVKVSAVVPTYNGRERLDRCLAALAATEAVDDVIVLDGGSTDGSTELVARRPDVRLVRMDGTNITRRLNVGVRQARHELVLILNDDAFVDPETPARLSEVMLQHARVGAAGASLRYEDGRAQVSAGGYRTLTNAVLSALWLNPLAATVRRPAVRPGPEEGLHWATWLPLCVALVRKTAFEEVGGLDERYSFYGEDHDFARQLDRAGWRLVVRADAGAVHLRGAATSATAPGPWFAKLHQNRFLYLSKYYPRAWRVYAAVWAARASLHMVVWRARAIRRRLSSDEAGELTAREWVTAFRQARWPASRPSG